MWTYTFDYPISGEPRWGYGRPSHPEIKNLLESRIDEYIELLKRFQLFKTEFSAILDEPSGPTDPAWNNSWFSTLDAAALISLIALRVPKSYFEIGSGNSTKFVRRVIRSRNLSTRVISIDPNPRAEINQLCDEIIRQPLETLTPEFFDIMSSGDVLFFDGSHRIFENSDVATFFFDILPRAKPGMLVHIHDIFWPDDYPPEWKWRYYSEQYLLGALILGGSARFRVLLPNYFVSHHPSTSPLVSALGIPLTYPTSMSGVSFWLEVV